MIFSIVYDYLADFTESLQLNHYITQISSKIENFSKKLSIPYLGDNSQNNVSNEREWLSICISVFSTILIAKYLYYYFIEGKDWIRPQFQKKRDDKILDHLVIPARSVEEIKSGSRVGRLLPKRRQARQFKITTPPENELHRKWRPLLVFANTKSGNGLGKKVLDECRKILHPIQIHDLSKGPPESTLNLLKTLPKQRFIILACGGDGTINWIFSVLDKMQPETEPYLACLPLGTGNDLSRVFNWGSGYTHFDCVRSFLASLILSEPMKLDRWIAKIDFDQQQVERENETQTSAKLSTNPKPSTKPIRKIISFQNYISVGTDAATMLDFHESREKVSRTPFKIFSISRTFNKFWIGLMTVKNMISDERNCKNLPKKLKLQMDGKNYEVPEDIECLLFLNVWSWASGIPVWRQGLTTLENECEKGNLPDVPSYTLNYENPPTDQFGLCTKKRLSYGQINDGVIEVLGFTGGIHLGEVRINLKEPIRLGQCRTAKMKIIEPLPFQADGEPWLNQPATIEITSNKPRIMLHNRVDEYFRTHAEDDKKEKLRELQKDYDRGDDVTPLANNQSTSNRSRLSTSFSSLSPTESICLSEISIAEIDRVTNSKDPFFKHHSPYLRKSMTNQSRQNQPANSKKSSDSIQNNSAKSSKPGSLDLKNIKTKRQVSNNSTTKSMKIAAIKESMETDLDEKDQAAWDEVLNS